MQVGNRNHHSQYTEPGSGKFPISEIFQSVDDCLTSHKHWACSIDVGQIPLSFKTSAYIFHICSIYFPYIIHISSIYYFLEGKPPLKASKHLRVMRDPRRTHVQGRKLLVSGAGRNWRSGRSQLAVKHRDPQCNQKNGKKNQIQSENGD